MKKTIISLSIILSLLFGTQSVFANHSTIDTVLADDISSHSVILSSSKIAPQFVHYSEKKTIVDDIMKYHVFTGNLESVWAKRSEYHRAGSFNVSSSFTYKNIIVGVSYSSSSGYTIPADSSRYSKLSAFSDVRLKRIKVDQYAGGVKIGTYYYVDKTYTAQYIDVVYK